MKQPSTLPVLWNLGQDKAKVLGQLDTGCKVKLPWRGCAPPQPAGREQLWKVLAPASRILDLLASTQTASLSEYKKVSIATIIIKNTTDSSNSDILICLEIKVDGIFPAQGRLIVEQSEYNSENHIRQPTIKKIKVFFSSRKGITTNFTRKKNLVTSFWTWAVLKSLEAFMTNSGDNISVRENAKSKALENNNNIKKVLELLDGRVLDNSNPRRGGIPGLAKEVAELNEKIVGAGVWSSNGFSYKTNWNFDSRKGPCLIRGINHIKARTWIICKKTQAPGTIVMIALECSAVIITGSYDAGQARSTVNHTQKTLCMSKFERKEYKLLTITTGYLLSTVFPRKLILGQYMDGVFYMDNQESLSYKREEPPIQIFLSPKDMSRNLAKAKCVKPSIPGLLFESNLMLLVDSEVGLRKNIELIGNFGIKHRMFFGIVKSTF
ncbi:hypothetical protein BB561_004799 [Smittium simulii]|uniref:Uncharacterized protein n=1 Tax=Smittium simulii TaxID=133385 RepID=A0A2T9YE68_9FUNG|nr:hypothetical protein BB561_004799 [Smittium simulii]